MPEITPVVELTVSPGGSPAADQERGDRPPDATTVVLYGIPPVPPGIDAVVIPRTPTTVTVVVASGMLTPLAWMVVVPRLAEVIRITIPGEWLPSQMKIPVACIGATEGLLEDRLTLTPSFQLGGALALKRSVRRVCWPTPTITTSWVIQLTVAVT